MRTWHEAMNSGGIDSYDNYGGDTDHKHFLMFLGRSRDSNILELSNFDSGLESLGGESATVIVARFGHWGVGWIEEIMIDPKDTKRVKIAEDIESALADYPVLDDEDYYRREHEEELETWDTCYRQDYRGLLADKFPELEYEIEELEEDVVDNIAFQSFEDSGTY